MLPALAELSQLAARIPGGIPSEDEPRAQAALEDASALVRDECGRDFVTPDDELDAPDAVVRVVLAVARRDYLNPEGTTSDTETVGPHSRTTVHSDAQSASYLTEAERAICQRYREGASGGLSVLSTTRAESPGELDTIYVRDELGSLFPLQAAWEFRD